MTILLFFGGGGRFAFKIVDTKKISLSNTVLCEAALFVLSLKEMRCGIASCDRVQGDDEPFNS